MKSGIIIHPSELTDQMLETLIESGICYLGLHPAGGQNACTSAEECVKLFKDPVYLEGINKARAAGIKIEIEMHAISYLLPRSLFGEHPEWFRLDADGNRVPETNFCPSNEEALDFVSDSAEKLARLLPSDTGRYYFWTDDVSSNICHCDKCKGLNESDQALLIYNAILKGLKRVDLNAKQCFLAYAAQREPDENGNFVDGTLVSPNVVKPDKDIFLELAPMRKDTVTPFENEPNNARFNGKIEALLDVFGKSDSKILDYWFDNSMHSNWTKPPKKLNASFETINQDIALYKSYGFELITSFGCFLSDDYTELYGKAPIKEYVKCFE